jgi:hypothetical protein
MEAYQAATLHGQRVLQSTNNTKQQLPVWNLNWVKKRECELRSIPSYNFLWKHAANQFFVEPS